MEKIFKYNFLTNTYRSNSQIVIDEYCNGFTAINIGATVAYVNGVPLNAATSTANGESISFGGNRLEVLDGRLDVRFVGNIGELIIIQKIYLPGQF